MPRRRTRKEQQAHTRSCLMQSAAKVFARRGLQQASIDEVAGDAGFTKGDSQGCANSTTAAIGAAPPAGTGVGIGPR